ncbi:MAG: hypothetical protein ACREPF_07055, partial [Rhodanobacteraceae bacterium]
MTHSTKLATATSRQNVDVLATACARAAGVLAADAAGVAAVAAAGGGAVAVAIVATPLTRNTCKGALA